ncbi:hypothetical protein [Bacillus cereus]|uniref:hypothetical protein n=1 Tax=Bacillus cereus TaxID=1396 RepID=UPI000BEBE569|nr:hypothetical protein [Bacillus cereus]PDY79736.1 hypothetical protein CON10_00615 [Bacillus cereus]PEE13484.1 hypothetical protein CON52_02170 [Bacillus cereus]PFI88824.1 hypothetical protein COI80_29125 [Bacillus cereus]PFP84398.1 hypothetical protein COK08_28430 [Bacillus cereus]PFR77863.1 hypothetical protein COK40_06290 [Bacillus cereus]
MGVIEKDLYSLNYPEFKAAMCKTGWTWIPCPTWSNPTKKCKQDINTPCTKTKTSRFRVYVRVDYPDSLEPVIRQRVQNCHVTAAGVAAGVIYTAATASSVVGPAATIAAAIGAIGPAAEAYGKSFYTCLTTLNLPDAIKNNIKANLYHEDKGITDWRDYYNWSDEDYIYYQNQNNYYQNQHNYYWYY